MSRLINANLLIQDIQNDKTLDVEIRDYYAAKVDGMETAFDVEKVVETLDNEAQMLYSTQTFKPVKAWKNEYLIPIVEAGGTLGLFDVLEGAVKDE